jgi:tRNA(fMet)-specific endonuclease VapC
VRYLVDSDWLINAMSGRPIALNTLDHLSASGLAVSIVTVAEIFEGAFSTDAPEETLMAFRHFLSAFPQISLTDPIVERFARVRASLRRQGQLIPDMDLLIAATALEGDLTLVTRNVRHFDRIEDLKVYQPH